MTSELGGALVLIATAGILGVIASAVSSGATRETDETLHEVLQSHRSALDAVARPITLLSLPILVVAATAGLVLWLRQQDRTEAAIAIGFAPVAAAALGQAFTMVFPRRNPPDKANVSGAQATETSFPERTHSWSNC